MNEVVDKTADRVVAAESGLKEWAVVCEALGQGRQIVVVRAGGLEDPGFDVPAVRFALLPTRYHEDGQHIRADSVDLFRTTPRPCTGSFEVRFAAEHVRSWIVRDAAAVGRLAALQVLTEDTLRSRFDSRDGCVTVAALRVFRLPSPVALTEGDWSRGCRSWVQLPVRVSIDLTTPVLPDRAFSKLMASVEAAIAG